MDESHPHLLRVLQTWPEAPKMISAQKALLSALLQGPQFSKKKREKTLRRELVTAHLIRLLHRTSRSPSPPRIPPAFSPLRLPLHRALLPTFLSTAPLPERPTMAFSTEPVVAYSIGAASSTPVNSTFRESPLSQTARRC